VFEARHAGPGIEAIADIGAWKSSGSVQAVIEKHYRVPNGKLASEGQAKREAYRDHEKNNVRSKVTIKAQKSDSALKRSRTEI